MKQNTKWFVMLTAAVIVFSCLPYLAMAQGPDPDAPLDGGLSLLLAAGVGYGIKKIRDARK